MGTVRNGSQVLVRSWSSVDWHWESPLMWLGSAVLSFVADTVGVLFRFDKVVYP